MTIPKRVKESRERGKDIILEIITNALEQAKDVVEFDQQEKHIFVDIASESHCYDRFKIRIS